MRELHETRIAGILARLGRSEWLLPRKPVLEVSLTVSYNIYHEDNSYDRAKSSIIKRLVDRPLTKCRRALILVLNLTYNGGTTYVLVLSSGQA